MIKFLSSMIFLASAVSVASTFFIECKSVSNPKVMVAMMMKSGCHGKNRAEIKDVEFDEDGYPYWISTDLVGEFSFAKENDAVKVGVYKIVNEEEKLDAVIDINPDGNLSSYTSVTMQSHDLKCERAN